MLFIPCSFYLATVCVLGKNFVLGLEMFYSVALRITTFTHTEPSCLTLAYSVPEHVRYQPETLLFLSQG